MWERKFIGKEIDGVYIAYDSYVYKMGCICNYSEKATFRTEKQAKSALAYAQLTQLMALPEYNGDWVPDWNNNYSKFIILRYEDDIMKYSGVNYYNQITFKSEVIS